MLKKTIKKLARSLGVDLKRYNVQTSEAAKMQRLLAYHNIDLVFDVGANIGQYAKLLRELGYSGRIVSFEPLSSAYSQLKAVSKKRSSAGCSLRICPRISLLWIRNSKIEQTRYSCQGLYQKRN